ncbi:MAG: hypothetical protein COS34_11780 [Lysobacterales bacterium CG02_land_8_20_14_3_00_62_12]|nr:MAG: hypothetical protein COS34_11780 [Xanthomonadales bacterium CG02_land_8_20_14_3_00_62_12]
MPINRQSSGLRMNRPLPISLAVALALGSSAASALGLGGIVVTSDLNQPLRAEIPVITSRAGEAEGLRAKLAAAEEFTRVGLSISSVAVPITFDVTQNARGETVIQVSSDQPVREPFLTFLVEVNWANGRILREYSVLLDPPISAPAIIGSRAAVERIAEPQALPTERLSAAPPSSQLAEPEAAPVTPLPEPESTPAPAPAATPVAEAAPEVPPEAAPEATPEAALVAETAAPAPAPAAEPAAASAAVEAPPPAATMASSEYGPVATGETLWEIATTTRPNEAVTLNQMMLALLRANPDAFYQQNVNTLKRGAILRIPGPPELSATNASQATVEVLNQNRSWIEATRPTLVADTALASTGASPSAAASGSKTSSRLELVPPGKSDSSSDRPGSAGGTGAAEARAEVARTKEALSSSQKDARELRARIKELEGISEKSERLIQLKDSELKGLQDRLAAADQRAREASAQLSSAQKDALNARLKAEAETRKTQAEAAAKLAKAEAAAKLAADALIAKDTQAAKAALAAKAQDVKPATTAVVASNDPSAQETNDVAAIPDPSAAPVTQINGSASDSSTAAAAATDQPINAETKPLAEAEAVKPVPVSDGPAATPWYRNSMVMGGIGLLLAALAAIGLIARKRNAAPTASTPGGSLAGAFANGVDGTDAADSVETDLLNALAFDPTDLNAHLNVLEYFYTRRDPEKFEGAAEAMYAQVADPSCPEWQGVILMGMDISPTHPLFSGNADTAEHNAVPDFGEPAFAAHQVTAEHVAFDEPTFAEPATAATPAAATPAAATPAAATVDSPPPHDDFDFVLTDPVVASTPITQPASPSFDFDLGSADSLGATPTLEVPSIDLVEADQNPTAPAVAVIDNEFLGDDAVATKIDLARAYLDMGDSDGARSMLEEVISEGNASQRDEARELLKEIG